MITVARIEITSTPSMSRYAAFVYQLGIAAGITSVTAVSLLLVRRHHRRKGRLGTIGLVLMLGAGLLMASAAAAGHVYRSETLNNVIESATKVEVPTLRPRAERPAVGPLNFLVLGSDGRHLGDYATGDGDEGERADVLMILKVEPATGKVVVVSIPRDWYVTIEGSPAKINDGLRRGGPPAQVDVVESMSGIPIDHYVEVDFKGFVRIVDEIGGVVLCTAAPARDAVVGLEITAAERDFEGCARFDGIRALNFVRSRAMEFYIDGTWQVDPDGDLGRIRRQQHFLDELLKRVLTSRDFRSLPRLASSLGAALTFDAGFNTGVLQSLLDSFQVPSADKIRFLQLPGVADNYDAERDRCEAFPVCYVFPVLPDADYMLIGLGGHRIPNEHLPFGR